ncbi:MAG: gliding motility-associated C-terminal domain-containing protein [Saprospiraceae bacterium]
MCRNSLLWKNVVILVVSIFSIPLSAQMTWVVNAVDDVDDGLCNATHCSLREAINAANNNVGLDLIAFNIPGTAPFVIEPLSPLPKLTDEGTVIDGTTQPGYALGDIVIDGNNTTPNAHGLDIAAGNTGIYGLKIINFDLSNNASINIGASSMLTDIIIGAPNKGNIVGNSHQGIFVNFLTNCSNITIQSNYVGVDPSNGMADIGNAINGIVVMQGVCSNVLIGGDATQGEGNVVGFNSDGIRIRIEGAVVQGNFVGTDPTGTMNLGNTGFGINLDDSPGTPNNCLIGGPNPGQGNTIAFNNVGIFKYPSAAVNRFQRNSFFCNSAGIVYQSSTTNGTAPPAILCISTGLVEGKAAPNTIIEVYKMDNSACANNNACQGTLFLGETTTNATGDWRLPINLNVGDIVAATATNLADNTSTFGNCTIIQNEIIAIAENTGPFCQEANIQLQGSEANNTPGLNYAWTGPDNYSSTTQNPTNATVAGTYYLEVSDNTCVVSRDSTVVEFLSAIVDTIGNEPNEMLCPGASIAINGNIYDVNNPNGMEMLPGQGTACDTVLIIQLQFLPVAQGTFATTVCEGESISLNGTIYDQSNSTGTEILAGQAANGCDSIVNVVLSFLPAAQGTFEPTVCEGESFTFNGTVYDQNNRTGTEVLAGQAANGCDSIVNVTIQLLPAAQGTFEPTICSGESITFNGTVYDQNNNSGTEVLAGQAANGCDSIVNVTLNFFPIASGVFEPTICPGESITFNGTVYDQNNNSGTEALAGQAANGCDSIVNVTLNFFPIASGVFEPTICPGESITFNGTVYDQNNNSGTEVLAGQAANGCDSIVNVTLNFFPIASGVFEPTICPGESITFNGTMYDETNNSGTEVLAGQAANGCDSIVNVELSFFPIALGLFEPRICSGESITFNGTVYDETNNSGIEVLAGQAANGCDSIVDVELNFFPVVMGFFEPTICQGSSITFNGTVYDEVNNSGIEVLAGQAANGCDSMVTVTLSFFTPVFSLLEQTLCAGATLTVNGTLYDESNPSGTEVLSGASANGCDSVVMVNLSFINTVEVAINQTLCPGESLVINGQVYDQNNPIGTETVVGGAGVCDSVFQINLNFFPVASANLAITICPESEVLINGTIYNAGNPSGVEILSGASANGCDSIINVQLTFEGLSANLKAFPPSCFGENDGEISIESILGGAPPYAVALNGGPYMAISNLPISLPSLPSGAYTVSIKDVNDCMLEQSLSIPTPDEISVVLGEDLFIRLGDSVQLEAIASEPGLTVSWSPQIDLSCTDCLNPIAKPLFTSLYTVTVSSGNTCLATDDIRIVVDPKPPVFMATVFSPNDDGVNDFFLVQTDGIIQEVKYFAVFDRWGAQQFERRNFSPNDENNGWDGTFRGKEAPVGVYVYFLEIERPDGQLFRLNGDVMLMR